MMFVQRGLFAAAIGMAFGVAGPALAGGGNVMPPEANPKGYTLAEMAVITGPYNTGKISGSPDTPPPPNVPFAVVVGDITVKPGTMLYVPVYFADDAGTAPPGFPDSVADQAVDAAYLANLVRTQYGITSLFVSVDGQVTTLGGHYVSGVVTSPLLDGSPTGTRYIVMAAFLTPLTPGSHTVSLGGIIDGKPVVFVVNTVLVR